MQRVLTTEEVDEILAKRSNNKAAITLAKAAYTLRLRPKHVLDLEEGRQMVAFTVGSFSRQDVLDAEGVYEHIRHTRGLGLMAKKAADKTPVDKKGKTVKEPGERRMTVARFLYEDVFLRKAVGTDEEVIAEIRKKPFCGETFKTNDKSAKTQLAWYKGKFTRGEFPGAIEGKVYSISQPFTSAKKKETGEEGPQKRKPRKNEIADAEAKAAAKKPKLKGAKATAAKA